MIEQMNVTNCATIIKMKPIPKPAVIVIAYSCDAKKFNKSLNESFIILRSLKHHKYPIYPPSPNLIKLNNIIRTYAPLLRTTTSNINSITANTTNATPKPIVQYLIVLVTSIDLWSSLTHTSSSSTPD